MNTALLAPQVKASVAPAVSRASASASAPAAAPTSALAPTSASDRASGAVTAPRGALRFLTAGSVDDGKSTLIGRLLYDSRAILADQLDTLHAKAAGEAIDLSQLTDGLEAEREQGITIDVAYRYFATRERKFIIADAPGHEQYTRNMVTAAAGSDAAVVLVDITKLDWQHARSAKVRPADANADADADAANSNVSDAKLGRQQPLDLLPQTRRHALLAQLLRVPSIVFAINKLDAVADPGAAFAAVSAALERFALQAGITHAGIVPVSALRGDNVTVPLTASWYSGPSLLQLLEQLPSAEEPSSTHLMLPVQYVARDEEAANGTGAVAQGELPRTLWGRIAHGQVRVGDELQVFPSGVRAKVAALRLAGSAVSAAHAGQSAGVVLDRQVDVSRGDWLGTPGHLNSTHRFAATLAWLDVEPATLGRKYWVRHGNRWVHARITAIEHRLDIHTLQPIDAHELQVNEIGHVVLELAQALPLEPYGASRVGGALIVVDPSTHRTSGALLVRQALGDA
jgi:sulfate adenylyltransferase subunit 1